MVFRRPVSISGANFAFKQDAFKKAGGYDPRSYQPDQWGIARRLSRFGRIYYDDKCVVVTSARRVAKPLYVIGYEIIRNVVRLCGHFFRHCLGEFNKVFDSRGAP
jgi:hypothetical protein